MSGSNKSHASARKATALSPDGPQEHQLPKRRKMNLQHSGGFTELQRKEFEALVSPDSKNRAIQAFDDYRRQMDARMRELQAGKGGLLFSPDPMFTPLQNFWIAGYLGLTVDEKHGEIRREGHSATVHFQIDSLEWEVFSAAWNAGEIGCNKDQWKERSEELQNPIREKSIRKNVKNKLRVLGIRLELRRPPRLVAMK